MRDLSPRGQEGRASGGHLLPTGKLRSGVPEVPRSPLQKGTSHTLGAINLITTGVLGLAHPIEID